ncbi:MAG TPA: hypothetical protein VJR92_15595 [Gemmatimonadaceae bacterium]|nr:hypothetical protein [Gemmatimonadaceae bacterium]
MRSVLRSIMAMAVLPMALGAQGAENCSPAAIDGCRKAEDLYKYMMPQLGLGLAGGNPTLGHNGVIGKLGHFNLGLRVTGVQGAIPKIDETNAGSTGNVDVEKTWVPAPAFDAALGVFGGVPLGVTRVGSVDALVSFMYLPSIDSEDGEPGVSLPDGNFRFGYGARIGLIEEAIIVPAVSFTYLNRGLPKVTVSAETQDGYTIGVNNLDMSVTTWRLMATKSLLLFSISAGYGEDTYDTDALISALAPGGGVGESVDMDIKLKRKNMFAGLTLNLGPIDLGLEVGRASGGTVTTFNTFDPKADAARTYASLGIRFGL